MAENHADHTRRATFITSAVEKRVLLWLAERLPRWVLPDHLTLFGIFGAGLTTFAYLMSGRNAHWLTLASLGFAINWFGDSLDVARVRRIQRPRYGYYFDHLTDAISTLAIGLALDCLRVSRFEAPRPNEMLGRGIPENCFCDHGNGVRRRRPPRHVTCVAPR